MTTIINTPGSSESDSSGWAVSVIILILVIAAGAFWFYRGRFVSRAPQPTSINIVVPTGNSTNPN